MLVSIDQLLKHLGQPGRYQIMFCLFRCFNYFQISFNHLGMSFFGAAPLGYYCGQSGFSVKNHSSYSVYDKGGNVSCLRFGTSKADTSSWCHIRSNCTWCSHGNARTQIIMADREWTIVSQFDLVCNQAYLNNLASTIYFLGVMIGGLVFGYLADRFGRLPVLITTTYVPICVGVGLFFANHYVVFVVLRFVMGFLMQGLQIATMALAMEYFSAKHRVIAVCAFGQFWCFGVSLLSLVGFLIRDWRLMQLCMSLSTLLTITYVWLYRESLRWLIAKGKHESAEKLVKTISKFNGIEYIYPEFSAMRNEEKAGEKIQAYSALDMLRNRTLLKRSILLWYMWLSVSVGYYGLAVSVTSLPGNKYTNSLIGGGVELIANTLKIPAIYFLGRRWPLAVVFMTGGAACVVSGVIDGENITTILAMVGRCGISAAFGTMMLYASELYPTPMRSMGLGSGIFWTRLGGFLAPQINLLGTVVYTELSFIIFGVLSIVAGILTLILPETCN